MGKLSIRPERILGVSILLLAALLAMAACAAPAAETAFIGDRSVSVATAPAITGSITTNRAYAARVDASDQVDVVPRSAGQVSRLDVGVGAAVTAGDVLGELRHGGLDARLEEAQAKLTSAQARLEQAKAAAGPSHAAAQAKLDAAQAKFDQLLDPTPADLHMAESVLADAQSRQFGAQTALDRLLNPTPATTETAKSAVVTAKNQLADANISLTQLQDPTGSDLVVAKSAVEGARRSLASAQAELDQLSDPSSAALQTARSAVTVSERNLDSARTRLAQVMDPPADAVARAQKDVAVAQQVLSSVLNQQDASRLNRAILGELTKGSIGDPWTEIMETRIGLAQNLDRMRDPFLDTSLSPEQITALKVTITSQEHRLATLLGQVVSSSSIPDRIRAALWDESQARLALESARGKLEELMDPSEETLALARNNVDSASARLNSAQAKFQELTNPDGSSMERAMSKVAIAQAALDTVEARLDELEDPTSNTIALAVNRVATARAAYDSAQARLEEIMEPDPNTVAEAENKLEGVKALVSSASSRLETLLEPDDLALAAARMGVAVAERELATNNEVYSTHGIDAAEANVAQARAQVALVQQQLEDMKVVAPFDGIITQNQLSVGSMASPQTPVFTIATTEVVVSFLVEETVIGALQAGRMLQFTSPALPNQVLDLKVARINPTAGPTGHTFLVKMEPVEATAILRPGVSGQVSISIQRGDTLLVPKEAVLSSGSQSSIYVVRNGVAHLERVAVGLSGDHHREILDGLQPGSQVVVSGQHLLTDATPVTVVDSTGQAVPAS